jgi:hypothetical protein
LIKPVYKSGVISSSNLTSLKQNMIWYFARQLDANKDYSTDTSSQVTLSTGLTSLNLGLFATDTTSLVSAGSTTNVGIGVLSLSYATTSLIFDYSLNTASVTPPAVTDYACGSTESNTLLPLCVMDLVANYLYDEMDAYAAVVAWKNVRSIQAMTSADFLSYVRTIRGDRRFRLYSKFFTNYQEWNKFKRSNPLLTTIDSTNLVAWVG